MTRKCKEIMIEIKRKESMKVGKDNMVERGEGLKRVDEGKKTA